MCIQALEVLCNIVFGKGGHILFSPLFKKFVSLVGCIVLYLNQFFQAPMLNYYMTRRDRYWDLRAVVVGQFLH